MLCDSEKEAQWISCVHTHCGAAVLSRSLSRVQGRFFGTQLSSEVTFKHSLQDSVIPQLSIKSRMQASLGAKCSSQDWDAEMGPGRTGVQPPSNEAAGSSSCRTWRGLGGGSGRALEAGPVWIDGGYSEGKEQHETDDGDRVTHLSSTPVRDEWS